MDNQINPEKQFPLFTDTFYFSSDLELELSNEIRYPSLYTFFDNIKSEDFQQSFPPKKKLFKTKKINTSFVTFKFSNPLQKQKEEKKFSIGRWTKQERIKFAEALYHFGMDWNKINAYISTRNIIQLRSHAQKFLKKLKKDKFIVQKGLDFKEMNWQQSLNYLKEKLTGQELLNILYSIETELDDNKRMTEKYLQRKRLSLNKNNLITNDESLNSSSNSTFDEFNFNSTKKTICEQQKENLKGNNSVYILLPLDENEDNNFNDVLSKDYYSNKKNVIFNNEFISSNFEENIDDIYSLGQEGQLNITNLFDLRKI